MTVKALIFDFDGLIVDTEAPDWATWCAIYRQHGIELDLATWQAGVGTVGGFDPCGHLETLLGTPINREAIIARQREQFERLCMEQPVLPGVHALIEAAEAEGLQLGLASSSSRRWIQRWLHHHELEHCFSCIRTRDDVKHPKPAPDLYLSVAACLDVAPEHCVAFEDSLNGLRAALAAGMRCIVVPTEVTATLEFPGATLRLMSLADLSLAELLEHLTIEPEGHA